MRHTAFVDTFNFSFFDDKPAAPEDAAPPSSPAPAQTQPEPDPFGFDEFAPGESDAPPDFAPAELDPNFSIPANFAPDAPTTSSARDVLDLPSEKPASEHASDTSAGLGIAPSTIAAPDLSFESSAQKRTGGASDLDFASAASDVAEANDALALDTLDFAPIEPRPTPAEVRTPVEPPAAPLAASPTPAASPIPVASPTPAVSEPASAASLIPVAAIPVAPLLAAQPAAPEPAAVSLATTSESAAPALLSVAATSAAPLATTPAALESAVTAPTAASPTATLTPTSAAAPPAPTSPAPTSPAPTSAATPRLSSAKGARFLTADDPYGEVALPRERMRVAVLGASGIGKNHARWLAKHSCDVVSFLGSSDESIELTRAHLEAHMGFVGRGFSDLTQLLNATQPQAVCIASPSPLHYAQAMQCLEAGIHVLCEKPLVYTPSQSKRQNTDGARELLKAAAKRDLVLATQLQYGAATPILCRLAGVSPLEVGDFAMEVETTNAKAPRDSKGLWIELAPHPLSVAQYIAGDGAELVEESVQIFPSRSAYTSEVSARFGVRCAGGRLLMCRAIVRWFDKIVDNREPRRRFSFNGRVVQYSGVRAPDGTYIAQYVAPDGYISHYSDPVDYLVGNFVRTCWGDDRLLVNAEQGVQNLDWLLATADKL